MVTVSRQYQLDVVKSELKKNIEDLKYVPDLGAKIKGIQPIIVETALHACLLCNKYEVHHERYVLRYAGSLTAGKRRRTWLVPQLEAGKPPVDEEPQEWLKQATTSVNHGTSNIRVDGSPGLETRCS